MKQGIVSMVILFFGALFTMFYIFRAMEIKQALLKLLHKFHDYSNEIKLTFNSIEAAMI